MSSRLSGSCVQAGNIVLLSLFAATFSCAAPPNTEHTVLAWSGDTRPGGGGVIGTVDVPAINDSGAVAFIAGTSGVYQGSARTTLRLVAQVDGAAPGGGEQFSNFFSVIQDNAGRVLFDGTLKTGAGG